MFLTYLGMWLLPALVVTWLLVSAWRTRRQGTPWLVNASLVLVTIAAVISVMGAGRTALNLQRTSHDSGAITAPVGWYSHMAVKDLVAHPLTGVSSPVPPKIAPVASVNQRAHAIRLQGEARIPNPTAKERFLSVISHMLPWLVAALSFAAAVPVLRNASVGDPFAQSSITGLRVLGWTLLIGLVGINVANELLSDAVLQGHAWIGDAPLSSSGLHPVAALPGLAVLALVLVYRAGARASELEQATV